MRLVIKVLIAILLVILGLGVGVYVLDAFYPSGPFILADELDGEPETYVEFNLSSLERYPYVREAVFHPGDPVWLPYGRTESVDRFMRMLRANGTSNIRVCGEYYRMTHGSAP